jgi:hypothetical protein
VIACDNQRAETESASAFHDFRAAIDEHDLFGRIAFLRRRFVSAS